MHKQTQAPFRVYNMPAQPLYHGGNMEGNSSASGQHDIQYTEWRYGQVYV